MHFQKQRTFILYATNCIDEVYFRQRVDAIERFNDFFHMLALRCDEKVYLQ